MNITWRFNNDVWIDDEMSEIDYLFSEKKT